MSTPATPSPAATPVTPAPAPSSPKGSANWVAEAEAYIKTLESEAVALWKNHQVIAVAILAFVVGNVAGAILGF